MMNWLIHLLPQRSLRLTQTSERCVIRTFTVRDAEALASFLWRNREAWSAFEPIHGPYYYTKEAQRKKIRESYYLMRRQREYTFGMFLNGELIGHIALYAVKRKPYQSGFIGYAIDQHYARQGLMTEAVEQVIRFAFHQLQLHRLEAHVAPANLASQRVLQKVGFEREGLLRQLLWLNGKWEDHYLYALLKEENK